MLTFTKACLANGYRVNIAAYQVGAGEEFPREMVLLCLLRRWDTERLAAYQKGLVSGQLMTLLADVMNDWAKPDFKGIIYRVVDTVGLREITDLGDTHQFMVSLRHVDYTPPTSVSEEVEFRSVDPEDTTRYERLLLNLPEATDE